ncbi:MAG TPA: hypothetical protein VE467_15085 [Chryseolinea sp.]|jgi:hypothetical protein|nr:hypothetical protein [Chryseolinea sp.]HZI25119.1 hypothetical protein [Chryseolinea sp.]
MKVNSTIYKGIEFVEISTLPSEQKTSLLQTVSPDLLIKILVDGKLMPRCIQYKDYEEWYDNSYRPIAKEESGTTAVPDSRGTKLSANLQV